MRFKVELQKYVIETNLVHPWNMGMPMEPMGIPMEPISPELQWHTG